MTHHADPHNFGRRVTISERGNGIYYQKPRSLFWEWLFFGRTSPLSTPLQATVPQVFQTSPNESLSDLLFGLDITFEDHALRGISKQILPDSLENVGEPIKQGFPSGALLAYCYTLGIQDLHSENVIFQGARPQVVDAEMVLSSLLLPQETLLLPFKETKEDRCGLRDAIGSGSHRDLTWVESLLAGFTYASLQFMENRESLTEQMQSEVKKNPNQPIRVILRDTRRYRHWQSESPGEPFFVEELIQLRRGDVPYFFKYLGGAELFYYTSESGDFEPVNVPSDFLSAVTRTGVEPTYLLSTERLRTEILPRGLLYLARTLLPDVRTYKWTFANVSVLLDNDTLTAILPWESFTTSKIANRPS